MHPTLNQLDSTPVSALQRAIARIGATCPELTRRAEAAGLILLGGKVHPTSETTYEVVGAEGKLYLVDQVAESCTCLDYQHRAPTWRGSRLCKHRIACLLLRHLGTLAARPSARLARLSAFRHPTARRSLRKVA